MPFYQSGLGGRLEYELLTFNDYSCAIIATVTTSRYRTDSISLEYEIVNQLELAFLFRNQCNGRLAILYDRVLRHRKMVVNKMDSVWNINLNVPARSMKGILMLFEDPAEGNLPWCRETESFYNPKITNVEVTIEGLLFSQGMRAYQLWGETKSYSRHLQAVNVTLA